MAHEIEAAAADAATSLLRRKPKHALPAGTPCPNCATPLEGPFCHVCGQSSDEYHRSIPKLVVEAVQGMVEYDGRLWRTLPDLLLNPARLTRDYLDGHRSPQVPPFRMFLIVVVLIFLTGGIGPKERNRFVVTTPAGATKVVGAQNPDAVKVAVSANAESAFGATLGPMVRRAMQHPDAFDASIAAWAHRLAILALPLGAGLLSLVFIDRKGVYGFDHLIFAMHSLAFQGLLLSLAQLVQKLTDFGALLILLAPVHLFFHLRGVYRTGVFGTLWRMAVILFGGLIGAMALVLALIGIGLYEVGGAA